MKKFFLSDIVLVLSPIIYAIGVIFFYLGAIIQNQETRMIMPMIIELIIGLLLFVIVWADKVREKKVMKGLIGMVLMGMFVIKLMNFFSSLTLAYIDDISFSGISLFLFVIYCILHFVLEYGHSSKKGLVFTNQILLIVLCVVEIAWNITHFIMYESYWWLVLPIVEIGFYLTITCIETKIDNFKLIREAKSEE